MSSNQDEGTVYTPLAVANFFIGKSENKYSEGGRYLDPLKIQKIIYFAFGYTYGLKNRTLFNEAIQAWKFGPVVPSLYHEFKHYQYSVITELGTDFDWVKGKKTTPKIENQDKNVIEVLTAVWDTLGGYSASDLVTITHGVGTPWYETSSVDNPNIEIPREVILGYFKNLCKNEHTTT